MTYYLRPLTVHIGLLKSTGRTGLQKLTERIGLLKLKAHICLLGSTGGKGLQSFDTLIIKEGINCQLLKMVLLLSSFLVLLNSDVKA